MGPVIELHKADQVDEGATRDESSTSLRMSLLLVTAAVLGPMAVAAAMIPWRARLTPADGALVLVVVIVAVATSGRRGAAAVCAVSAGLAFDVFLTRPYGSLRIARGSDVTTEVLLLIVGLAVGDLAARGRRHRTAARDGRRTVRALHALTELSASGHGPRDVADQAEYQLRSLLALRDCTFTRADPGLAARILPDGEVRLHSAIWSTEDLGLPRRGVDLPVRGAGVVLAHFVLVPAPGARASRDQLAVAVAIADQVGAALAAVPTRAPAGTRR